MYPKIVIVVTICFDKGNIEILDFMFIWWWQYKNNTFNGKQRYNMKHGLQHYLYVKKYTFYERYYFDILGGHRSKLKSLK